MESHTSVLITSSLNTCFRAEISLQMYNTLWRSLFILIHTAYLYMIRKINTHYNEIKKNAKPLGSSWARTFVQCRRPCPWMWSLLVNLQHTMDTAVWVDIVYIISTSLVLVRPRRTLWRTREASGISDAHYLHKNKWVV